MDLAGEDAGVQAVMRLLNIFIPGDIFDSFALTPAFARHLYSTVEGVAGSESSESGRRQVGEVNILELISAVELQACILKVQTGDQLTLP